MRLDLDRALSGREAALLFAVILASLDNIQTHLENPFDQIGEDDITINAEKFAAQLKD